LGAIGTEAQAETVRIAAAKPIRTRQFISLSFGLLTRNDEAALKRRTWMPRVRKYLARNLGCQTAIELSSTASTASDAMPTLPTDEAPSAAMAAAIRRRALRQAERGMSIISLYREYVA
jgi:hypothetical protein